MKIRLNKKNVLEHLAIAIIILTSGTYLWYHKLGPAISCVLFLFYAIYYKCKHPIGKGFKTEGLYLILAFICLFISFILHRQLADNQIFGFTFLALGSYFILTNFNINSFKQKYLEFISWLCIYSLPIYLLTELEISPFPIINHGNYLSCMGVTIGWSDPFHRFASIFHEPGACQIILNLALILYIPSIQNWRLTRNEKVKLLIVLTAILFTKSTGGYLTLMIIILCCFEKKIKSKSFIPIVAVLLIIGYFILNSPIIQNKINPEDGESVSLLARQADAFAMLQMISEEPITGYGLGSKDHLWRSNSLGNWSNSNGILYMISSLGIPWFLIFLIFLVRGIIKFGFRGYTIFLVFCAFLMLESNEKFMEFPISYILLFTHKKKELNLSKSKL